MLERKRITILIPEGCFHGRKILEGVRRYVVSVRRKEWIPSYSLTDAKIAIRDINGGCSDGIITYGNKKLLDLLVSVRLPCVTLGGEITISGFPNAQVDDEAVGQMGAQYLLDRGFKRFAYIGPTEKVSSGKRFKGFIRTVQNSRKDYPLHHLEVPRKEFPTNMRVDSLLEWINSSSQPVGLMVYNDMYALLALSTFTISKIPIPDKVAVLGVDNNTNICELSDPEISSVNVGFERLGYRAAQMMDDLMAGGVPPREPILIPPIGVVTRQSTNIFAVDDDMVAQAGRYISEHACDAIQVSDVAENVSMSRRALETRFAKVLGRSPHSEIRRVQMEKARNLLAETNLTISEAATACGFGSERQFYVAFKDCIGMSPGVFRCQHGIQSGLWQSEQDAM